MADKDQPSELVQRLHLLRAQRGITIQRMAELCGLPKSSLESYMRLEGARRPGLDALTAIADGLNVSIDWLAGRSSQVQPQVMTQHDYAMACFGVIVGLLEWQRKQHEKQGGCIFEGDKVAGRDAEEIAAKSMLIFLQNVEAYQKSTGKWGLPRAEVYSSFKGLLEAEGLRLSE